MKKYIDFFNQNDNLFISFLTKNGLSDDGIRGMMNRIGERCNVKIHPHRLRVTCITSLLNKGMPLQKYLILLVTLIQVLLWVIGEPIMKIFIMNTINILIKIFSRDNYH